MTREEIILMAEESTPDQMIGGFEFDYEQLIHFANLVAAAEREACAKVCDERAAAAPMGSDEQCEAEDCAAGIRDRGEHGSN